MADLVAIDRAQSELLSSAGQALASGAWSDARERYARALAPGESAEALEGLAVAAWWQDDVDAAICARERAYVIRRERDQTAEAATRGLEGARRARRRRSGPGRRQARHAIGRRDDRCPVAKIFAKLGVSSRAAAVALAAERDLLV